MDILALSKGLDQGLVIGQMRHQSQFDLAVIDRQQQMLLVGGDEGLTDTATQLVAHRNILQIGVG